MYSVLGLMTAQDKGLSFVETLLQDSEPSSGGRAPQPTEACLTEEVLTYIHTYIHV